MTKCNKKSVMVTWVDLPYGHRFGFPKVLPTNLEDFRSWAVSMGYPEEDIDFGMQHCRMWQEETCGSCEKNCGNEWCVTNVKESK
jgi:hypothetical protein